MMGRLFVLSLVVFVAFLAWGCKKGGTSPDAEAANQAAQADAKAQEETDAGQEPSALEWSSEEPKKGDEKTAPGTETQKAKDQQ